METLRSLLLFLEREEANSDSDQLRNELKSYREALLHVLPALDQPPKAPPRVRPQLPASLPPAVPPSLSAPTDSSECLEDDVDLLSTLLDVAEEVDVERETIEEKNEQKEEQQEAEEEEENENQVVAVRVAVPKLGMMKTLGVRSGATAGQVRSVLLERMAVDAELYEGWVLRCVMQDCSTMSLDAADFVLDSAPESPRTRELLFTPPDRHIEQMQRSASKPKSIAKRRLRNDSALRKAKQSANVLSLSSSSGAAASSSSADGTGRRPTSPLAASSSSSTATLTPKQLARREKVLNELMATERDYVRDMSALLEHFVEPMRDNINVVAASDFVKLASNIDQLLDTNKQLLDLLESGSSVGAAFTSMAAQILRVYTRFAGDNPTVLQTLERLQGETDEPPQERFVAHVRRFEKRKEAQRLPVDSFMLKPIQRVCKYPLLLRELLFLTSTDDDEFEHISKAVSKMDACTNDINELKRFTENIGAMQRVAERFEHVPDKFKLITPTRVFVQSDTMTKISKGKAQKRHIVLFNDAIVYGRPDKSGKTKHVQFCGRIFLTDLAVRNAPDREHSFEIDRRDKKKKVYIIVADNDAQKRKWLRAINQLIAAQTDQSRSARLSVRLRLRDTMLFSPPIVSNALSQPPLSPTAASAVPSAVSPGLPRGQPVDQ
jgi:RhoGEF domain/SOS1/NGEF-like PH domain